MDLTSWINNLVMITLVFPSSLSSVVSARFTSPSVLDLMQHVASNTSSQAMKRIPGINGHSTAHLFQGSSRRIEVTHRTVTQVRQLLEDSKDFTIVTAIKQQEKTSGSIFSFTSHDRRVFELESSGRRDELRLHYFHSGRLRTETFPYRLADNQWHTLALGFSRDYIEVFIDCRKIYERSIVWLDWNVRHRRMSIFVGQRDETHAFFKGAIEYIALVAEPNGVLHICPHANIACPTCSQFRHLQHSIESLYEDIKLLSNKLSKAERKIAELEQCECQLSCTVNGTQHKNEERWFPDTCTTCVCKNGVVECLPEICPVPNCTHPEEIPGKCCPICRKKCYVHDTYYDHGETYTPQGPSSETSCVTCKCLDGSTHCIKIQCEPPNCPSEDQFVAPGQCCRLCKGTDFCRKGHDCHENATCFDIETRYKCECNQGFRGDGKQCEDIDECGTMGGVHGHYCISRLNSHCVNTIGSYLCECNKGFIPGPDHDCIEHDECLTGNHTCDINARCDNAHMGYNCTCNEGYEGDGHTCRALCREECRNGGVCVAPDVCQCRKGFIGRSCKEDMDECHYRVDQCHANSVCVNIPSSYICECKPGFYSNSADNQNGAACLDLDECSGWGGGHQCPEGTVCRNTPGGYDCVCISSSSCGGCRDGTQWHMNGTSWAAGNSTCINLSCIDGEIQSRLVECNCRDPDVDRKCCPHCQVEGQCRHEGKSYTNGQEWIEDCQQCHCLDSEVDCWPLECPRLSCKTVSVEGDCCPRCEDQLDPCHVDYPRGRVTWDVGQPRFRSNSYSNGRMWRLESDSCTMCECKGGHVCCQYQQNCKKKKHQRKRTRQLRSRRSRHRNMDRVRVRHYRNCG